MNNLSPEAFPNDSLLKEQAMFLLEWAVRSPSTHNIQPWKFAVDETAISLYRDTGRNLPHGDPTGREAFISLGACFEHLLIASKFYGMYLSHKLTPNIAGGPVATLYLKAPEGRDESLGVLMNAMAGRFNARGPFHKKEIPPKVAEGLRNLACEDDVLLSVLSGTRQEEFARLTARGMRVIHCDREFRNELSGWIRNNYSAKSDGIPGYTMLAPGLLSLVLPYMIRFFNMGSLLSTLNKKSIMGASGACLLFTPGDSPAEWFSVGMSFERISLFLATHDIRTSVFVASVEVPETRSELAVIAGVSNVVPQFAFAFGYPIHNFSPTPRINPNKRLIIQ